MVPPPSSWLSEQTEAIVSANRQRAGFRLPHGAFAAVYLATGCWSWLLRYGRGQPNLTFAAFCLSVTVTGATVLVALVSCRTDPVSAKTGVPVPLAKDDSGASAPVPPDNPWEPEPRASKKSLKSLLPWWFPREKAPAERPDQ
jgi:hypothetical protein